MVDTAKTRAEILASFPDNNAKLITPQRMRDFVVSVMPSEEGILYTSQYPDLNTAHAVASQAGGLVIVDKPSTIMLGALTTTAPIIVQGGSIAVSFALNITGYFFAHPRTVFIITGSGSVSGLREARPEWFGALTDGVTNCTTAFVQAVASLGTYGVLKLGSGLYRGSVSIRKNNVAIIGEGSTATRIKLLDSTASAPVVLELGDTVSGNDAIAYDHITVKGISLDGNKAGTPSPPSDLTGWGLATTKISYSRFEDLQAINCWNGNFGFFINSNYNTGNGFYSYASAGTYGEPGFDINTSKHNSFTGIISENDKYGIRLLDNCYNNYLEAHVKNATYTGAVYSNQLVNESHNNNINVTVEDGCAYYGMSISANCRNSRIAISTYNVLGTGLRLAGQSSHDNDPRGLTIELNTKNSGASSLIIDANVSDNDIVVMSDLDGRSGAQGAFYAIDIYGNRNKIKAHVIDSATWQVRGVAFRSGAVGNHLIGYDYVNTNDPISDLGTATKVDTGSGFGADIASASTIIIPLAGNIFFVSGTTNISTISVSFKRVVTLIFSGSLTVIDGSNLKLNGNLTAGANTTLTLFHDGSNWYEISRSVN